MESTYDRVVLGADVNGLTTACMLAKKGHKVLLLEERNHPGGIAMGPDGTENGLLLHSSLLRNEIITTLDLTNFGLQMETEGPLWTYLDENGDHFNFRSDWSDEAQLSKLSEHDLMAYREYRRFTGKLKPFLFKIFSEVPPDLLKPKSGEVWSLLKKLLSLKGLGKKDLNEFIKVAPMSMKDFLDERFDSDALKSVLAMQGMRTSFSAPWSGYAVLNLLIWEAVRGKSIVGGSRFLVKALEQAAKQYGVKLAYGSQVSKIITQKGAVTGVSILDHPPVKTQTVFSTLGPKQTFFRLIEPSVVPAKLEYDVQNYRSTGHTAVLRINLKHLPKGLQKESVQNRTFLASGTLMDIEKSFDPVKYGEFSNRPVIEFSFQSKVSGQSDITSTVMNATIHYIPFALKHGWSSKKKKELFQNVLERINSHFGDFSGLIVDQRLMLPHEIETEYGVERGHLYGGDHAIDQLFSRPFPSCARYQTPISGLWLCGDSTFPGGGLSCAPGFLCAKAFLSR